MLGRLRLRRLSTAAIYVALHRHIPAPYYLFLDIFSVVSIQYHKMASVGNVALAVIGFSCKALSTLNTMSGRRDGFKRNDEATCTSDTLEGALLYIQVAWPGL